MPGAKIEDVEQRLRERLKARRKIRKEPNAGSESSPKKSDADGGTGLKKNSEDKRRHASGSDRERKTAANAKEDKKGSESPSDNHQQRRPKESRRSSRSAPPRNNHRNIDPNFNPNWDRENDSGGRSYERWGPRGYEGGWGREYDNRGMGRDFDHHRPMHPPRGNYHGYDRQGPPQHGGWDRGGPPRNNRDGYGPSFHHPHRGPDGPWNSYSPPGGRPGGSSHYEADPYGRRRNWNRSRSRSISRSRSRSRSRSPDRNSFSSRSRSRSASPSHSFGKSKSGSPSSKNRSKEIVGDRKEGKSRERQESRARKHRRSKSPTRHHRRSPSSSSFSSSSSYSSSKRTKSADTHAEKEKKKKDADKNSFTKDQRTVFVNQLVMRTREKDIRRYFRRKVGCKVNDVELLRDKRTGLHKGCAYVELKTIEDVTKALQVSGQAPDFQRFPILVKASEAEKNYIIPASSATLTATMMGKQTASQPIVGSNGNIVESQKVYVGSLDPGITQEHIFALFSQLGELEKVSVQMDPTSGISKGYAFLSFRDPKEANLAIQTMSNKLLAGRPMKTGWASQTTTTPGVDIVTSDEFPEDATERARKAHIVLSQLTGLSHAGTVTAVATAHTTDHTGSKIPTVADARASLAAAAPHLISPSIIWPNVLNNNNAEAGGHTIDAKVIGNADKPTNHVLIHNMFDKDEETEEGWEEEIRLEFKEECSKYGNITDVTVMSKETGGKIFASFDVIEGAQSCASSLAGRWFDKRQLRVEYVIGDQHPKSV